MIRLSPSHSIFQGMISFTDQSNKRSRTKASLDIYHKDLRFEYGGHIFFYNYHLNAFSLKPKGIRSRNVKVCKFFLQELKDEGISSMYVSFIIHDENYGSARRILVQGHLFQQLARRIFEPHPSDLNLN
jgi:hypothetical protein